MSVKIKINWDNENTVYESVRIYRADSAFTSSNLPPLLAEIIGDAYEYEDFSVTEGSTYFYTLSVKLGEQEVFTECYEVVLELPNPYDGIYIIGSASDAVPMSMLSEIISEIGDVYTKTWAEIDSIPETAKLIYAPHLDYRQSDTFTGVTKMVTKFNTGIPVLISIYTDSSTVMPNLGIGANFSDSSGSSIDIVANTVLGVPFDIAQSELVIRETSHYMSGIVSLANNAKRFAVRGSTVVGAILPEGAINRNNVPSPANVTFAGFAYTESTRLLNETGKNLVREIVRKTMR